MFVVVARGQNYSSPAEGIADDDRRVCRGVLGAHPATIRLDEREAHPSAADHQNRGTNALQPPPSAPAARPQEILLCRQMPPSADQCRPLYAARKSSIAHPTSKAGTLPHDSPWQTSNAATGQRQSSASRGSYESPADTTSARRSRRHSQYNLADQLLRSS